MKTFGNTVSTIPNYIGRHWLLCLSAVTLTLKKPVLWSLFQTTSVSQYHSLTCHHCQCGYGLELSFIYDNDVSSVYNI